MGKCKDCRWFGETNDSSGVLSVMVTCCQKNAPAANAMPIFPSVGPDDGCGEFEWPYKDGLTHSQRDSMIEGQSSAKRKIKISGRKTDEDIADKKIRVIKEIIREAWTQ